ncbi:MAG: LysM peptidoglycan-binding domain-containing protein [Solirubrobacteraceae bacterium]
MCTLGQRRNGVRLVARDGTGSEGRALWHPDGGRWVVGRARHRFFDWGVMPAPDHEDLQREGVDREGLPLHVLVPGVLIALLVAIVVVAVTSLDGSGSGTRGASGQDAATRRLPVYWTVKRGQTYAQIAEKTGLSIEQLETFNPKTDPNALLPGTRLKLRLHVPPPKPKRKGPRFWTVRTGQSYGSIAAKTGHSITKLQQLNPKLKPTELQPGDRVRLRP